MRLQRMLDALPDTAGFADVWKAFKQFAARRVFADPPEQVNRGDELMLFECGSVGAGDGARAGCYVGLLRQLPIEDEDGDHDWLEELRCEILFDSARVKLDADEALWSDGALETWCQNVEASVVFKALIAAGPARSISVDQSSR